MFCSWIFLPCQIGVTTSRCVHSYNTVHDWSVMFLRVVMLSSELTLCDWQTVVTCFGGSWRLTPNNASRSSRPCNIRGSAAVSLSMSVCLSVCLSLSLSLLFAIHHVSEKSSTSYFAEYFCTGFTDCKNFNGYRVRDNQRTQVCNQCFNF